MLFIARRKTTVLNFEKLDDKCQLYTDDLASSRFVAYFVPSPKKTKLMYTNNKICIIQNGTPA